MKVRTLEADLVDSVNETFEIETVYWLELKPALSEVDTDFGELVESLELTDEIEADETVALHFQVLHYVWFPGNSRVDRHSLDFGLSSAVIYQVELVGPQIPLSFDKGHNIQYRDTGPSPRRLNQFEGPDELVIDEGKTARALERALLSHQGWTGE